MNAAKDALVITLVVAIHGLIAALLTSLVLGLGTAVLATILNSLGLHLSDAVIFGTVGIGSLAVALTVMAGLIAGKGDVI